MKNLVAATAIALSTTLAVPAMTFAASQANSTQMGAVKSEQKGDFFAADFIGKEIYISEKEWDENYVAASGWEKDWDNIGQVENVLMSQDGNVRAVILEVGGFLDIGDKHVAVLMDELTFVRSEGEWDNYFLAMKTDKDTLMGMEKFTYLTDEQRAERYSSNKEVDQTTTASVTAASQEANRPMLRRPGMITLDGYSEAATEDLTTEALTGARIYGANNEDIGEIDELIVGTDGKVSKAVLGIGGFLGLGEHSIAVTMDEMRIMRTEDGDDFRVYIDATQEELEQQPKYEG